MKSREKILNECSQKHHGFVPPEFDGKIWDDFVMEAMDIRARDCMIELIKWHRPEFTYFQAEHLVDGFIQSEYFKELQK